VSTGKKLLKRREIALRLGQVSGKQILAELLKALLKLLFVRTRRGGGTNLAENAAGNSKDTHVRFLFSRLARKTLASNPKGERHESCQFARVATSRK
jgi:hypothetical protein